MNRIEFIFELKLKGSKRVFRKGMGIGVLVSQQVALKSTIIGNSPVVQSSMLVKALMDETDAFIEKYIEVKITQKKE